MADTFSSFTSFLITQVFIFALAFSGKLQSCSVTPHPQRSLPRLSFIICWYCSSTHHLHLFPHYLLYSSYLFPFIHIFYFSPWRNGYMIKGEGKEFDIPARASSRPPLASEPRAPRTMLAGGYPGHQKRVSIKRRERRGEKKASGELIGYWMNQSAGKACTGRGGPRLQSRLS